MTGEVAGWIAMADSMFASAGDVVFVAAVTERRGGPTYDATTGQMAGSADVTFNVQAMWQKPNAYKLPSKELFTVGDRMMMVRGSDFGSQPTNDSKVATPVGTYRVVQWSDPTGIGAYYLLHVRK